MIIKRKIKQPKLNNHCSINQTNDLDENSRLATLEKRLTNLESKIDELSKEVTRATRLIFQILNERNDA